MQGSNKNNNKNGCAYGKVTRTMLLALEKKFDNFYSNDFKEVKNGIKEIQDKINNPRPSWAMTVVIVILSNACTALVAALLRAIAG